MNLFNKKDKDTMEPLTFFDKGEDFRESPISFFDAEMNGERRFAILKTTDGGKYMRGNTLYYSLNGVEVYTDPDNVIFVNLDSNTMFIRTLAKVNKAINPENPETREYIILFVDLEYEDEETEYPMRWEAVTGRSVAYETIKLNAPVIDIDKSLVLVDNVTISESLTVRQFMEYIKNGNLVDNAEDFDINDFGGSLYY